MKIFKMNPSPAIISKNTFINLLEFMNSDEVVYISGFMFGFLYNFRFRKSTLQEPLNTILGSAFAGMFTTFGTGIVAWFLPRELRFIIPSTLIASCVYYKFKDLTSK